MRFRGIVYRAHNPQWAWPAVSGEGARLHGGRFNRKGIAALYTSLSPAIALREAGALGQPLQPLLLCAYRIDAEPVFDSLDPRARSIHAVNESDLSSSGWEWEMRQGSVPPSQSFADRLMAAGYVGMQVRSFAPGAGAHDLNLVLWRWGDRLPSCVALIDDEGRMAQ